MSDRRARARRIRAGDIQNGGSGSPRMAETVAFDVRDRTVIRRAKDCSRVTAAWHARPMHQEWKLQKKNTDPS
jgi:hypothetical protein